MSKFIILYNSCLESSKRLKSVGSSCLRHVKAESPPLLALPLFYLTTLFFYHDLSIGWTQVLFVLLLMRIVLSLPVDLNK